MSLYAVVDTNVLISALLSKKKDTATVRVLHAMLNGYFLPLWNHEIIREYDDVLHRSKKYHLDELAIQKVLQTITTYGKYVSLLRISSDEEPTDPDDMIFWRVMMTERKNNAFLITGNIKHFPRCEFVVTPAEMVERFGW